MIYLFTGLGKLGGQWLDGTAIYWVLQDVSLTRWPYRWLPVPLWLCQWATWGTLVFEIGFPVLICFRRLRPWLLGAGVLLHLGILLWPEVGWFSQSMLCWYVLFLPGETLARWNCRASDPPWIQGRG